MKRIRISISILLLLSLVFLASCGQDSEPQQPEITAAPVVETPGLREYNKGLSSYNGDGVERNFEKALEHFLQSANENFLPAMEKLGFMYEMGFGTEANPETAALWFTAAAQRGSEIAQKYIDGVGHLDEQAIRTLLPATAVEEYDLGMKSFYGVDTRQNYEEAFAHFARSAAFGYGRGYYGLAVCCLHGKGADKNIEKATEHFEKALELGCLDAADRLILIARGEYGGEADSEAEQEWLQRRAYIVSHAAEQGYDEYTVEAAENALAVGDYSLAEEWYRDYFSGYEQPAEEGDAEALLAMAVYHLTKAYFAEPTVENAPNETETQNSGDEPGEAALSPDVQAAVELLEEAARKDNIYAAQLLDNLALERDEELLESSIYALGMEDADYVYPTNINYWLLYENAEGEYKVKLVYIPMCGNGELTEVCERFTKAVLCELRLNRKQYINELPARITHCMPALQNCRVIAFVPLDDTLSLYEMAEVSTLFALSQQFGEYSGFMQSNYDSPGNLISLGELAKMYLQLIPEDMRG